MGSICNNSFTRMSGTLRAMLRVYTRLPNILNTFMMIKYWTLNCCLTAPEFQHGWFFPTTLFSLQEF